VAGPLKVTKMEAIRHQHRALCSPLQRCMSLLSVPISTNLAEFAQVSFRSQSRRDLLIARIAARNPLQTKTAARYKGG
jgi:hypothetical protein